MELTRRFPMARFDPAVVRRAVSAVEELEGEQIVPYILSVYRGADRWSFDSIDEWYGDLATPYHSAHFAANSGRSVQLSIEASATYTQVQVKAPERASLLRVMSVFEDAKTHSAIPAESAPEEPVKVFIGHGRSDQWRDLKDHLQDDHGYNVVAFETGARAGHAIRDILEEMLNESSFAVLLHTGEDEMPDGGMRARQNVIHETGLFQGKLGFARAVVLLEDGTEDYSNLQGVVQIRYARNNIKETYGAVLAALRREFGR